MARPIEIDVVDLVSAMTRDTDIEAALDPETGRIEEVYVGGFDSEPMDDMPSHEGWLDVPRVEGRTSYGWMSDFADGLDEDDVRGELIVALDGPGAFGRFRRTIGRHPDLEAAWHRFRDDRLSAIAKEWLEGEGFAPTFVRRAAPRVAEPPPARVGIGLYDVLLLGAPDGKTELLEGRVARVFLAASPSDARAVFKNVARDLCVAHDIAWRKRFVEGRNDFEAGRYHLSVDGARVDLEIDVTPALWRAFSG
jgi:hypothetical protein